MSTLDIMLFFSWVVVPVSFFGIVMYCIGYSNGKRTHFPTVDEVLQGMESVDGFYRAYDSSNYVVIRKVKVQ